MLFFDKKHRLFMLGAALLIGSSTAAAAALELDMESLDSIRSKGGKVYGGGFAAGTPAAAHITGGNRGFVSGGAKEGIELPISALPLKKGSISLHFKVTAKAQDGQGISFISAVGTPPYHNNFSIGLTPQANGSCRIGFVVIGDKSAPQTVQSIYADYALVRDEFYHLAANWENINSGKADGSLAIYLNGKLIASRSNAVINVPAPGNKFYIGSVDLEHTINKCGEGAFVIDEVQLKDSLLTADDLKKLTERVTVKDLANGDILPGMPVKAGGKGQYNSYHINNFPIDHGAIYCSFKLDEVVPGKSVILFDNAGTPPWHDRIAMMLKMHENNILEPYFVTAGTPTGAYLSRVLSKRIPFDTSKQHTMLAVWKNLHTGQSDGVLDIYLDGVNIGSMTDFATAITNPSDILHIGGCEPPAGTFIRDNILTVDECRIWRGDIPPVVRSMLLDNNSSKIEFKNSRISLPRWEQKFVNNGKIDKVFWQFAADFGPLHGYRTAGIAAKDTQIKAACDDNNLYLAWRCKYENASPTGKKYGIRDVALWNEDSVELHFDTPKGKYSAIISAYGEIYDSLADKSSWTADLEYAVANEPDRVWTGTAVIPLNSIRSQDNLIRGTVCRNIEVLQSNSSSWSSRGFGKTGELSNDSAVAVTDVALPDMISVGTNQLSISAAAFKLQPHVIKAQMSITINGKSTSTRTQREITTINAISFPVTFTVPEEGKAEYTLIISDEKDNVLFANCGFLDVKPPLSMTLKRDFYNNKLHVQVNAVKLAEPAISGKGRILKDGKAVTGYTEFKVENGLANIALDTSTLSEHAEYTAEIAVTDKTSKVSTRTEKFMFAPKPFGYPLGAGMKPYFGNFWFKPQVNNTSVKVWNRVYSWKNSIFPASITSGGVEILAATPYFEYRVNGQIKRLSSAQVTPAGEDEEKSFFDVVAADDNLSVKAKVRVEYDGFIGYDMDVEPKAGRKIDQLAMIIPLQKDSALFKLQGLETTYSPKRNHVENYPAEGGKFPFDHKAGLGGYDRGIFFCNESDEGWLPYDRDDTEVITLKGDQVIWRWNIVDGAELKKLPTQRMGFQITPYKPLIKDNLQSLRIYQVWPGGIIRPTDVPYKIETLQKFKNIGANVLILHMDWCKYTGSYEPDDPERFRNFIKEAHRLGMRVLVYRASITNEFEPSFLYYGDVWLTKPVGTFFSEYVQPKFKRSSTSRCVNSPGYIDWYVGMAAKLIKEYDVDGFYYDFGVGSCNNALHGCGYAGVNTRSRSGEATGTIGINIGEVTAEDRARRVTRPVLGQRELWKRMYNMVKELKGEDGMIDAHTSAPERVFSYPFVDTMWHSESAACHKDLKITLNMYRLFFSKEKFGTRGELILYLYANDDEKIKTRSLLALTLPHREIYRQQTNKWEHPYQGYYADVILNLWKVFQTFRVDDAQWIPYWKSQDYIAIENGTEDTAGSIWLHEDQALVVISNLSGTERELTVSLKGALKDFVNAEDMEDAKSNISVSDGKIKLTIPNNDYRLFKLSR